MRELRILLERNNVNPNTVDKDGRTPLSLAVRGGDEEVVRLLLERNDVNLNIADHDGQTAASWAAQNGSDIIAKLLRDQADFTPIYAASSPTNRPLSPQAVSETPSKRIRRF